MGVRLVEAGEDNLSQVTAEVGGIERTIMLRSGSAVDGLLRDLGGQRLVLDITGLSHHVWAPIVRVALSLELPFTIVYVEPLDYRPAAIQTDGDIFDLSERIRGIAPLPGFTNFAEPADADVCLIALLGFEGTRFSYVLEQMQPPHDKIVPIVGIPGFRLEFPFHTYLGNQSTLRSTGAWQKVRYVKANCPFSLWYALRDVAQEFRADFLKIALIGTKPHALGGVLFSLTSAAPVELIHDHPIRKVSRSAGTARVLQYNAGAMRPHVLAERLPSTRAFRDGASLRQSTRRVGEV